jgi:hypothetical protein
VEPVADLGVIAFDPEHQGGCRDRQAGELVPAALDIVQLRRGGGEARVGRHHWLVSEGGYLWDTTQEKAIEKGNLIHLIMSQIKTVDDIAFVFEDFLDSGKINKGQITELKLLVEAIVGHDQLKECFKPNLTIYNEKDILTSQGEIVRPDRMVIDNNNQAVILDYKTGAEDIKHKKQLQTYQDVLEDMNFEVIKKILVYVNHDIQIKEF